MPTTKIVILALLASLVPACGGVSEGPAPAPECAWVDETYACDPALFTREVSTHDEEGIHCAVYTYHCGDYVDACKREVYDCQPTTVLGGPDPGAPRAADR